MEGSDQMTIQQVSIKARNKKEMYTVLTVEGGLYLPLLADASQSYLKAILHGKKKYLLCKDVIVLKVPHIENLRVNDIVYFASKHVDIKSYMPEYAYNKNPQREWICNVTNTLLKDRFKDFITISMRARENKLVQNKGLSVVALPQFIKVFADSNNVSISKGRTHFLMEENKRKRQMIDMETDNHLLELAKEKIEQLETKITQQQDTLEEKERIQSDLLKDKEKLVKLYQAGYIDSDGEPK